MKKILILLMVLPLMFMGCSSTKSYVYTIDYSKYSKEGFFITESQSVHFEYVPISYVEIALFVRGQSKQEKENGLDLGKLNSFGQVIYSNDDAIKSIYNECVKLGANGLIGMKMRQISEYSKYGNNINGVFISGTAIKKKQ